MKITVTLTIDEYTLLEESGQGNLQDAINQELGWLHDSGMLVDHWTFDANEQQKTQKEAPALSDKIAVAETRIPNLSPGSTSQGEKERA